MNNFLETSHLSEILEKSDLEPVIVFKYSNTCSGSTRIKNDLEKWLETNNIRTYIVTVQKLSTLSRKITELFGIKHESPQVLIINKQKVVYEAHHNDIFTKNFVFQ